MTPDLTKQIAARFEELPEVVQKAIQSADVPKKIQEIGTRHTLHVDQLGTLEDETLMVMMGFVAPDTFAEALASQLQLSPQKAEALAGDISKELFLPIREAMQEFIEQRELLETLSSQKPEAQKAIVNPPYTPPAPTPPPPAPVAPAPTPSAAPKPAPAPAPTPKPVAPQPTVPMEVHDVLQKPTISTPSASPKAAQDTAPVQKPVPEPPKPAPNYKTDPYREIPE